MGDRAAVMRHGSIVETGIAEFICDNPQRSCTRSRLSELPLAKPHQRRIANHTRLRSPMDFAGHIEHTDHT